MRKKRYTPQVSEFPSADWFSQAFHDAYCYTGDVGKDFRTAKEREPFKSMMSTPQSTRNSKVLTDFIAYCKANPGQRFWQALLNWSGLPFIVSLGAPAAWVKCVDEKGNQVSVEDTYNWEGKNG